MTRRYRSTAHLWVIEGLGRPARTRRTAKRWFPLYMYRDQQMAKAVLRHLIDLDPTPKEISNIEDFRLVPPDPRCSYEALRREARKARRAGEDPPSSRVVEARPQERPVRRSGVVYELPSAVVVGRGRRS